MDYDPPTGHESTGSTTGKHDVGRVTVLGKMGHLQEQGLKCLLIVGDDLSTSKMSARPPRLRYLGLTQII